MQDVFAIFKDKKEINKLYKNLKNNQNIDINKFINNVKTHNIEYYTNSFYFDHCIKECIYLWIDLKKQDYDYLSDSARYDSMFGFLKSLGATEYFKQHLLISSLYTIRYMHSDKYMKASYYIYWGPNLPEDGFKTEEIGSYTVLEPNNAIKYPIGKNFNNQIKLHIESSLKTHQKYFYETAEFPESNGNSYYIRLFLPTFAYIFENSAFEDNKRALKIKYNELSIYNRNNQKRSYTDLNSKIREALQGILYDYNLLIKKFIEDDRSKDCIETLLFYYKLERVFPITFLSNVFKKAKSITYNDNYVLELSRLPDIQTRCKIFNQPAYFYDIDYTINSIFPSFEKLFFLVLIMQYNNNYIKLDADLSDCLKNRLYDITPKGLHVIEEYEDPLNLCTLYEKFKDNFIFPKNHYEDDIYRNYNSLMRTESQLNGEINTVREYNPLIRNRYQLLESVVNLINGLFGANTW